ncbi:hypothetical protein [uncultured Microscilla sp.]|uniref:hypothetical protein n=1 Tax=uncultured Microscilla sp. TaxID=432653 RepID=UPI002608C865|nr:hypothetical protein [uncultured Microscilla sp.]
MSIAKEELQRQFEAENPQGTTKPDKFYCGVDKFVTMLRQVALMRKLQKEYFKTKNKEVLKKAVALEAKIDKALAFYQENEGKLHDCPFV